MILGRIAAIQLAQLKANREQKSVYVYQNESNGQYILTDQVIKDGCFLIRLVFPKP